MWAWAESGGRSAMPVWRASQKPHRRVCMCVCRAGQVAGGHRPHGGFLPSLLLRLVTSGPDDGRSYRTPQRPRSAAQLAAPSC